MNKAEFTKELNDIRAKRNELNRQEKALKQKYANEVMERNGYHIGDKIVYRGEEVVLVGAEYEYFFHLLYARIKKDGTPYNEKSVVYGGNYKEE